MERAKIDASLSSWTQGYFNNNTFLDECFNDKGVPKEHWRRLLANVETLDAEELKNRQQELLKLLQENGVKQALAGQIDDPDGDDFTRHNSGLRQIHCAANFVEGDPDGVCLVRLEHGIAMIRVISCRHIGLPCTTRE